MSSANVQVCEFCVFPKFIALSFLCPIGTISVERQQRDSKTTAERKEREGKNKRRKLMESRVLLDHKSCILL